jgi:general secretion pathway protein H
MTRPSSSSPIWIRASSQTGSVDRDEIGDARRERSRRAGFTLIEMVVVLTILGLALTIVAGFIPRRSTTLELATASEQVASILRLARARATTESRPVLVVTAPDGHRVMVDGAPRILPASVNVSMTGAAVIRFAPDGSASGGGIRVDRGGRARFVMIDWLTGRVRIANAS